MARSRLVVGVAVAGILLAACSGRGRIEQPVVTDLPVAAEAERVDLEMPSFSKPTEITNPLFPVSSQASVLMVGTVEDQAFRTEVTLLPTPRIIEWNGQRVATLVSQYVAFLDGHLHEVAYDFYAQADDGAVWYFGEDVFNFADGAIVDTHGSWIAGADGPAGMIMPADPQVGDVYRPENIPGLVFEEVTVTEAGRTLDGPFGPIEGGLVVSELHMDGGTEEKTFAPRYGEFYTAAGGEVEALAMAIPTDAAEDAVPEALDALVTEAKAALTAASDEDWTAAAEAADAASSAWNGYDGQVPVLLEPLLAEATAALSDAVGAEDAIATGHAAIELARLGLDLQLRHRPVAEVDLARLGLWADELALDAGEEDEAAVDGDLFALDYVRERVAHTLDAEQRSAMNLVLEELQELDADGDFEAIADTAAELRNLVEEIAAG